MSKRSRIVATALGLALAASGNFSCKKTEDTTPPEETAPTDDGLFPYAESRSAALPATCP